MIRLHNTYFVIHHLMHLKRIAPSKNFMRKRTIKIHPSPRPNTFIRCARQQTKLLVVPSLILSLSPYVPPPPLSAQKSVNMYLCASHLSLTGYISLVIFYPKFLQSLPCLSALPHQKTRRKVLFLKHGLSPTSPNPSSCITCFSTPLRIPRLPTTRPSNACAAPPPLSPASTPKLSKFRGRGRRFCLVLVQGYNTVAIKFLTPRKHHTRTAQLP